MEVKKPNIILLLSDDQGEWAMGCSGNHEIITPNIDRIAREGIRFKNFFCASPVCSPARATLLTGRIPSQHGVHDWLRDDNKKQEEIEYLKGQTGYTDILSRNGYVCGLSGKWHLGKSSTAQKGFDYWFAHKSGGGPYYNAPFYEDGKLVNKEGYATDIITDKAIDFIKKHAKKQPFYLHVGYTAPHSPWLNNHPKEYTDLYNDCPFETCQMDGEHKDSIYLTKEVLKNLKENQKGYYGATTAMDYNIGRILDLLDELNIREDTLLIFMSDNGFSCGHHGFWGKGNATFPINMYESSVKVPCIISHKGRIPKGRVSSDLVSAYDFMPTLLEYLGMEFESEVDLPGRSFEPVLRGEELPKDRAVVVMDEYGPNRMIRGERYKFIKRYPYGPHEMYDLFKDPGEKNNLMEKATDESTELANKLDYELEKWFLKYVNPEIDGAKEAVYGSGQINLAGLWSRGEVSHSCDDYIKEKLKENGK